MKRDITRDVQNSNVLELSDAELAGVSGGTAHDREHGWGHEHEYGWGHKHEYHHWSSWGGSYWQDSDCFDGYSSQPQVIFVQQQSAPCIVIPSYSC
jgi:hypothetical protein